jgi:hypothetical protein
LNGRQQIVDDWYAESMAILNDRRAMEILGEQGHRNALLEVERLYQAQLAEIQSEAQNRRLTDMASFFGSLAGIAEAGGRGLVKAAAIAGGIQATINSYVAATEALKTPGLSLFGRFAAYASVLATGLKAVSSIRAAGGGGGGGSAVAAQGAVAAPQEQSRLVIAGLRPDDILTGQMVYNMFMGEAKLRGSPLVELRR